MLPLFKLAGSLPTRVDPFLVCGCLLDRGPLPGVKKNGFILVGDIQMGQA